MLAENPHDHLLTEPDHTDEECELLTQRDIVRLEAELDDFRKIHKSCSVRRRLLPAFR